MKHESAHKSITYRQFYDMVVKKTRSDPDWEECFLEYISYVLAGREEEIIGTHHFDVAAEVMYGSSGGIICRINIYIRTELCEGGHVKRVPLAMFKSRDNSHSAFLKMGRLAGTFTSNSMQVIAEHRDQF